MKIIPWHEVKEKSSENSEKWVVINGLVYDISSFYLKHPGGSKVICGYAGEDATDVWTAMHPDKDLVKKYLKPLLIGQVEAAEELTVKSDFRALRQFAEESGWFRARPSFFLVQTGQILVFEVASALLLLVYGVNWITFLLAGVLLSTAQAQAGWAQHDYGHLSVFNTRNLNRMAHEFVIGHIKGASSRWWNFRHNLHHSKPNVIRTDPDVDVPYVFLIGDVLPVEWAKEKRGFMPYNWQHDYFFLLGPPTLLPLYFHYENIYFMLKRRLPRDFIWTLSFFFKFYFIFNHFFASWWGAFALYMFSRFLESHWFTFVTQMSHIPMHVGRDDKEDWTSSQLRATCNVEPGHFNDWFTGHLNYQIEHHLFPDMPRHNYPLVKPQVMELCRRHGIEYQEKPLGTAFVDIYRSLRRSGHLWLEAYTNPG